MRALICLICSIFAAATSASLDFSKEVLLARQGYQDFWIVHIDSLGNHVARHFFYSPNPISPDLPTKIFNALKLSTYYGHSLTRIPKETIETQSLVLSPSEWETMQYYNWEELEEYSALKQKIEDWHSYFSSRNLATEDVPVYGLIAQQVVWVQNPEANGIEILKIGKLFCPRLKDDGILIPRTPLKVGSFFCRFVPRNSIRRTPSDEMCLLRISNTQSPIWIYLPFWHLELHALAADIRRKRESGKD